MFVSGIIAVGPLLKKKFSRNTTPTAQLTSATTPVSSIAGLETLLCRLPTSRPKIPPSSLDTITGSQSSYKTTVLMVCELMVSATRGLVRIDCSLDGSLTVLEF